MRNRLAPLLATALVFGVLAAAQPPDRMNYQGVLRHASDDPVSGSVDMVFRLFPGSASASELLVDRHTSEWGGQVAVSGGLFNVHLGGGAVSDGSSPGTYTTLTSVLAEYPDVWVEVKVNGETLSPRVRIVAAGYALNAATIDGLASGSLLTTRSDVQQKNGKLVVNSAGVPGASYGIEGYGDVAGGLFRDADSSGKAYLGIGDVGVHGYGSFSGVTGTDTDGTGTGHLGRGDHGVEGHGSFAGGYFRDSDGSGEMLAGYGHYGVHALGSLMGGLFRDADGPSYAEVGAGDYGIRAYGDDVGGYFESITGNGQAEIALPSTGIFAYGSLYGGVFADTDSSGIAYLGTNDTGVYALGNFRGGYFANNASGAYTSIATGSEGIAARGTEQGGYFADLDSGTNGRVAYGTSTITGTGTKNFVQNHPADPTKVIQYAALEGDEVGTYTRGAARLSGGEARVALGETFRWVTNPEVGLTAHLTPRGAAVPLAVASLTTDELVVRGPENVPFDYVVMGLRIGFERAPVVRIKEAEAFLPDRTEWDVAYAADPALASFRAEERFLTMAGNAGVALATSGGSAAALERALTGPAGWVADAGRLPVDGPDDPARAAGLAAAHGGAEPAQDPDPPVHDERAPVRLAPALAWLPAAGEIAAGDVVAFSVETPQRLRPAASIADPTAVGIAAGVARPAPELGQGLFVPVAIGGVVEVRVDAGYGAIRPGELLTSSPTPGHAMRALEALPGTVIGKALEPWTSSRGTIDVLVMPPR